MRKLLVVGTYSKKTSKKERENTYWRLLQTIIFVCSSNWKILFYSFECKAKMTYVSIHTLCVRANYFYFCKLKHDYCVKFLNVSKLLLFVIINSDDLNTCEYLGYFCQLNCLVFRCLILSA